MKYVNLTLRWTEILPTYRFMAEQVTTRDKPKNGSNPNKVMMNFWDEMKRMAQAADNYGDLVAYLRNMEGWSDDTFQTAIEAGSRYLERERTTVKED